MQLLVHMCSCMHALTVYLPCRNMCSSIGLNIVASILRSLPVVLRRLQRRHSSFLSDAVSAVLALSKTLCAATAPSQQEGNFPTTQHASQSSLEEKGRHQRCKEAADEALNSSSTFASGLEHFLKKAPAAVSTWPKAQTQPGKDTLKGLILQVAALTAPLPTVVDAPVLASLPPQEARALLDRTISHTQPILNPAQCTNLVAACMLSLRELAIAEMIEGQMMDSQEHNRSEQSSRLILPEDSLAPLSRAILLHAALTSERCHALLPAQFPNVDPDSFCELPSCVTSLLQAASQSQVNAPSYDPDPQCKHGSRCMLICRSSKA